MIRSLPLRRSASRSALSAAPVVRGPHLSLAAPAQTQERTLSSFPQSEGGESSSVHPNYVPLVSPFASLTPTPENSNNEEEEEDYAYHSSIGTTSEDQRKVSNSTDNTDAPGMRHLSNQGVEQDDGTVLRKRTHHFVEEVKAGAFTETMWKQSVELIDHWTRVNKLRNTPESVDQSFVLLDRILVEQETQNFPFISMAFLSTDLLRILVKNWNRCVRNFHKYSLEDQALLRYEYTPMEVVARLESYGERSPRLQLDTKTLNMIIDGASRCSIASASGVPNVISPRLSTTFVQSLFDRMNCDANASPEDYPDGMIPMPMGQHGNPNRRYDSPLPSTRPDLITYHSIIYTFARHGLASRAESFLERLYRKYIETRSKLYEPDVEIFTNVLLAWSRSDDPEAGERAEAILKRMQELAETGVKEVEPDDVAYTVVLSCWANGTGIRNNEARSQVCLQRALALFHEMNEKGIKSTRSFNVMLNVLAKAEKAKDAEQLFRVMRKEYENGSEVECNRVALNTVLSAWATSESKHSGDRALNLLDEYERHYREGKVADAPDLITYNNVMRCLTRAEQPERAEELLRKMKNEKEQTPDKISWNIVVDGYAKAKNPQRAEALLEEMYQECIAVEGQNTDMKPDIQTFCCVLSAWQASRASNAAERAEAIIRTMINLDEAGILKVAPTSIAYNILLACWRQSKQPDAPNRAEAILGLMEDAFQKGSRTIRPDAKAYTNVLAAYSDRNESRNARRILERQHQQSLPVTMNGGGNSEAKPNTGSYNKVLGAFARSIRKDSAQLAEELYKQWQQRFDEEEIRYSPTPLSVRLVLDCWEAAAKRKDGPYGDAARRAVIFLRYVRKTFKGNEDFPNTQAHNFILDLYTVHKCRNVAAAQDYFWSMATSDRPYEKPNVESLNHVLNVIKSCRIPHAAQHMENLIRQVKQNRDKLFDFQPNMESYRYVFNALENDRTWNAAQRAEAMLEELERDPSLTLDPAKYDQVVRIWTKADNDAAVFKADAAFRKRKALFYEGGDDTLKPSVRAFKTIISSWERSEHENKAENIGNLKSELVLMHGEEALQELVS